MARATFSLRSAAVAGVAVAAAVALAACGGEDRGSVTVEGTGTGTAGTSTTSGTTTHSGTGTTAAGAVPAGVVAEQQKLAEELEHEGGVREVGEWKIGYIVEGAEGWWVPTDNGSYRWRRPARGETHHVEIIPIDRPTVYAPQVGEHATFHGALVLDKAHQSWAEIHPCWLITTPEVQGFLESRPHLQLTVEAPKSVRVGDELPVTITVHSLRDGRARPVSRALLFLELVSPKGIVVRWEADYTNPLGTASTQLASLEVAGNYTIHIYASKGREVGHATHAFRIKRR